MWSYSKSQLDHMSYTPHLPFHLPATLLESVYDAVSHALRGPKEPLPDFVSVVIPAPPIDSMIHLRQAWDQPNRHDAFDSSCAPQAAPGQQDRVDTIRHTALPLGDSHQLSQASTAGHAPLFYWDVPAREESIISLGTRHTLRATGEARFSEIAAAAAGLKRNVLQVNLTGLADADIPMLAGGYSFGPFNVSPDWREFGAARFDLPVAMVIRRQGRSMLRYTAAPGEHDPGRVVEGLRQAWAAMAPTDELRPSSAAEGSRPGMRHDSAAPDSHAEETARSGHAGVHDGSERGTRKQRERWIASVRQAVERIRNGEFEKIVLARDVLLPLGEDADLTGMIDSLRGRFPDCYNFAIRLESGACFLGASPERLIQVGAGRVEIDALAGSAGRGRDEREDRNLATALLNSRKDRMEHRYVVQQIVQCLDGIADEVQYPSTPGLRKLANVQHLHTPVSARLSRHADIQTLMGRLHPTPAVGGYPAARAVPHIHELENIDRGWYAGSVGWFHPEGSGEFAVSIRSGHAHRGTLRLYAGCGIVEHSDPLQEWEETCLKVEPLVTAARQTVVEGA